MGEFAVNVRKGVIPQPTQKSFTLEKWANGFKASKGQDQEDRNLLIAGIWFYHKFEVIRTALPEQLLSELDEADRKKAVIANLNRALYVLDAHKQKVLEDQRKKIEASEGKLASFDDLLQLKFENTSLGTPMDPDTIVSVLVDGSELPLKYDSGETTATRISDLELVEKCLRFFYLGQFYMSFEEFWASCLWLGWVVKIADNTESIKPPQNDFQTYRTISEYRRRSIILNQKLVISKGLVDQIKALNNDYDPKKLFIEITKLGKAKKYSVSFVPLEKGEVPHEMWMKSSFYEFYLNELLTENLPANDGLCIEDLIMAWEVFSALYEAVSKTFPANTAVQKMGKLLQYSPQIDVSDLFEIISVGCKCNLSKAKSIVKALTFSGQLRGELWCKPIIEINDKNRIIAFLPVKTGHHLRTIELWMKFGGIDLSTRGKLFEKYCIDEIGSFIEDSEHCREFVIHKTAVRLSKGPGSEEIDLILVAGRHIFIGEAKCKLYPTDSIEVAHFMSTMTEASEQVLRKKAFAENSLGDLLGKLSLKHEIKVDNFKVHGFVLVNQPYMSGLKIADIPIIDLMILRTYITQGFFDRMAVVSPEGDLLSSNREFFYENKSEAEENLPGYISSPPQVNLFKEHIKTKVNPIPFAPLLFDKMEYETSEVEFDAGQIFSSQV
jgi:hypothetical protein